MSYRTFDELSVKDNSSVQEIQRCRVNPNAPLQMCLIDSMDRNFEFGGAVGKLTGANSERCQQYMAQRCAENWDGFCEYFYRNNDKISVNPITRQWETKYGFNIPMTTGENLLRNTAEIKYCTFPNCTPRIEPFNPIGSSTHILTYTNHCNPICKVDPKTIDQDVVMNRMLEKPLVTAGTLVNICNTSKNDNIDLHGTKIGNFCESYFENMKNE